MVGVLEKSRLIGYFEIFNSKGSRYTSFLWNRTRPRETERKILPIQRSILNHFTAARCGNFVLCRFLNHELPQGQQRLAELQIYFSRVWPVKLLLLKACRVLLPLFSEQSYSILARLSVNVL